MERPQILVSLLIIQSLFVVVYIGLINRLWYSYVLFLVFLGGILVIFIYISSLSSDIKLENFYNDFKNIIVCLIVVLGLLVINTNTQRNIVQSIVYTNDDSTIYQIVSFTRYSLYLFVVGYLLLALYCVCWLVKKVEGPLRKFN